MRPWTFHALRHFFCTNLVQRGASVEAIRVLAGHSSVSVTQRYLHATETELTRAMARFEAPEVAEPPVAP
jgi:site-specific recombinase XerD